MSRRAIPRAVARQRLRRRNFALASLVSFALIACGPSQVPHSEPRFEPAPPRTLLPPAATASVRTEEDGAASDEPEGAFFVVAEGVNGYPFGKTASPLAPAFVGDSVWLAPSWQLYRNGCFERNPLITPPKLSRLSPPGRLHPLRVWAPHNGDVWVQATYAEYCERGVVLHSIRPSEMCRATRTSHECVAASQETVDRDCPGFTKPNNK